ncbi:hypothetical protein ABZ565_07075 [Streptomyces sp. NPDC016469]|uniref:hypothetical protein n=1 Tax=Streptomyces sp. NPDC016469 TaxID=3157191 RepID=UPI0033C77947
MRSSGSHSFTQTASTAPYAGAPPGPLPAPPPCGVPAFPPLRVRGGAGQRLRRAVWRQRRSMAAGLALTAAALAVSGLAGGGAGGHGGDTARAASRERASPPVRLVSAPVRIADAETVRLLRPGDRVDVVASGGPGATAEARVVARGARVERVPRADAGGSSGEGALVVLAVPRATAADLAGAGISGGFAVVLC